MSIGSKSLYDYDLQRYREIKTAVRPLTCIKFARGTYYKS